MRESCSPYGERPIRYLFIIDAQMRSGTIPYGSFPSEAGDRVRVSNAASLLYILLKLKTPVETFLSYWGSGEESARASLSDFFGRACYPQIKRAKMRVIWKRKKI